ncbi:nondiscriminating aspartyl-tRNA synthetase [Streptoalloteichus tenebrarius]|uniref:Aspartate--tRNA(Asp/Asn) ligase n=1 Tax=Streptoalloteichus tenebrarius (strain ATCC 17920 / DSM 40477 / JCM 4838 / CBS 697.72 / NBRC 16177 / NCIMB 11028 / NRRL B-12390 / A12253. 1 / ISP 5477) TaxID=1933 RepID=A0ABT1HS01_STRSD|nr:aspartate--tRNA(Asn) ligase [Streptoalloteichus tenebrarius]MCP2258215.1 nondiscriminating aspartyl-tRNA synthetase [Streptoalloteichus tenebrarius]BFF04556.1 aspartate--tRNA(Asn) ligase [Streptoalloteichus tenebrarius]
MISRTLAADLPQHVGETVRLAGWVHRRRRLKSVTFLVVRDRSGLAQVVLPPGETQAGPDLTEETVVEVVGLVTDNPSAPGGAEITRPVVSVLSGPVVAPPFDLYRPTVSATLPTILDHAPVALRHPRLRARFAVAAASVAGFRSALDARGFTEVHTPKLVGTATESGATVFGVDYFGRRAYLAQSPQMFKQALVGVFERVYEVGPVFRAEPHDTTRHLAQYTSLDAELGFVADHHDVMAVLRDVVAGMVDAVAQRAAPAVELLDAALPSVPAEIPEIHFTEAQELLARHMPDDPRGEPDLAPAHERWLSGWALRTHGSEFLFVTGYPMAKRPFYTHPDPARPGYSNSFDLLFRGLELVTGGQRLHRHSDYLAALAARGENPEPYQSYLDVFAHGMPPHGGFAIGLERWTARLLGVDNIREVTLFPRDLHRLDP